jgi:hypothetical protein
MSAEGLFELGGEVTELAPVLKTFFSLSYI